MFVEAWALVPLVKNLKILIDWIIIFHIYPFFYPYATLLFIYNFIRNSPSGC
jgi:hypothetical protein